MKPTSPSQTSGHSTSITVSQSSDQPDPTLQQIEIIQLVAVLHDIPLDLAAIHPGDIILHVAGDQERRVGDDLGADADMALLDERDSLPESAHSPEATQIKRQGGEGTYRLNTLHHARPRHNHSQPTPAKRRHRHLPLHARQPRPLLAALLQDAHAPELVQHLALDLLAVRVRRVELREAVRERAQRAAERVVLLVVEGVLQVVAGADVGFAVVVVGFVGFEVVFAEESGLVSWGVVVVRDDGEGYFFS